MNTDVFLKFFIGFEWFPWSLGSWNFLTTLRTMETFNSSKKHDNDQNWRYHVSFLLHIRNTFLFLKPVSEQMQLLLHKALILHSFALSFILLYQTNNGSSIVDHSFYKTACLMVSEWDMLTGEIIHLNSILTRPVSIHICK